MGSWEQLWGGKRGGVNWKGTAQIESPKDNPLPLEHGTRQMKGEEQAEHVLAEGDLVKRDVNGWANRMRSLTTRGDTNGDESRALKARCGMGGGGGGSHRDAGL